MATKAHHFCIPALLLLSFPTLGILSFLVPAVQMTQIFLYGTLKKGQPNHCRILDTDKGRAEFLGHARTVEKYPLVIAGEYHTPYLLNIPGKGHHVHGEIYRVDDQMMKFLDEFEKCPQHYQRTPVQLEVEDWTEEGEDRPKVGNITEAFVYTTTSYQSQWLQTPMYESYDSYGEHGLLYVVREARVPKRSL